MPSLLVETFEIEGHTILGRYPALPHYWKHEDENVELVFTAAEATGFDVRACVSRSEIVVFARGAHRHFQLANPGAAKSIVDEAFALIRDLLSPDMRVTELCAAGRAYCWILEIGSDESWKKYEVTGLLFWNYVGRRSRHTYQNRLLPGRLGNRRSEREP